jgi:hypothetical protein
MCAFIRVSADYSVRPDGAYHQCRRPSRRPPRMSRVRTLQSKALRMKGMTKPDTPFPKHWLYYIVVKYVVIAAAVLITLYVASQLL